MWIAAAVFGLLPTWVTVDALNNESEMAKAQLALEFAGNGDLRQALCEEVAILSEQGFEAQRYEDFIEKREIDCPHEE